MTTTATIGSENYVSLTTYTRDGRPKAAIVRIAPLDCGKLGLITESGSWKVKRIENDDRVMVQPTDVKGSVQQGSETFNGTAEVVRGPEFQQVREQISAKYGFGVFELFSKIADLFGKAKAHDCAVIVTLDQQQL